MYEIKITYDTGDSFHQEHDCEHVIKELKWNSLDKAKAALKDIKEHYMFYMIMHKEWNVGKAEKEKAERKAKKSKWYENDYPEYYFSVEDDDGNRVKVNSCWTGYFDSMVGADIIADEDAGLSFRMK